MFSFFSRANSNRPKECKGKRRDGTSRVPMRAQRPRLCLELLEAREMLAADFSVDSLGDESASNAANSALTAANTITLRSAIEAANAQGGNKTIDFSITGTIQPNTALPTIVQDGVTIINDLKWVSRQRGFPGPVKAENFILNTEDGTLKTATHPRRSR